MRAPVAVALVAFLAVPGVATAAQCGSETISTGGYPSGTSPRYGLPDGQWTVTQPAGVPGAAISVRPVPGAWRVPFTGGTWVSSSGLLTGDPDPAAAVGTHVYERAVAFPAGATYLSLSFGYAIDNDVVWKLNGTVVGSWDATGNDASGWGQMHGVSLTNTAPLRPGPNVLTAEVRNRHQWEGLYVTGGTFWCV